MTGFSDRSQYGRNGTQRAVLSHAEVMRLATRQPEFGTKSKIELDDLVERLKYKDDHGGRMNDLLPGGAICLVAVPILARRDCAHRVWNKVSFAHSVRAAVLRQ